MHHKSFLKLFQILIVLNSTKENEGSLCPLCPKIYQDVKAGKQYRGCHMPRLASFCSTSTAHLASVSPEIFILLYTRL